MKALLKRFENPVEMHVNRITVLKCINKLCNSVSMRNHPFSITNHGRKLAKSCARLGLLACGKKYQNNELSVLFPLLWASKTLKRDLANGVSCFLHFGPPKFFR